MNLYVAKIGTLLVGILFNTFLYGLVTYQFAAYHRRKFNDRPVTKYMVLFLFLLDTFHSASVIYIMWYYTVTSYHDPAGLGLSVWPYDFTPMATALAALVTQSYLGFRIWHLTGSRIVCGVVFALAIPSFVLGVACSIDAWIIRVMSELTRTTSLVIAWLSMQVIADAYVTITLITIFSRWRGGFHKTDTILNRLIRGAIQTSLFSGIFSLAVLVAFLVAPNVNLYGMFTIPIGRIYTNTLMDTLLTRETIKTQLSAPHDGNALSGSTYWPSSDSTQASSDTAQSASVETKTQITVQEAV